MTRFAEPGARFPSCQMTHHAVKARDAPEGRAVWWFRNVEFLPHGPAHRGIGGTHLRNRCGQVRSTRQRLVDHLFHPGIEAVGQLFIGDG